MISTGFNVKALLSGEMDGRNAAESAIEAGFLQMVHSRLTGVSRASTATRNERRVNGGSSGPLCKPFFPAALEVLALDNGHARQ
jgi:hypothetical protein